MNGKKPTNKKSNGKKKKIDKDNGVIRKDVLTEDNIDEEILPEIDVEDNEDFLKNVKKFVKEHKKSRLVTVYSLLKKPDFKKIQGLSGKSLEVSYKKVTSLLERHKIIVHFANDYPLEEKYRFITEEIFEEYVEENKKKRNHVTFKYEEFHPEADDDDDF